MNYLALDSASLVYYLIDLVIALGLLAGLRLFSSLVSEVPLNTLLAEHNNFAAGISLAGTVIGVALMTMGAVSGAAAPSPAMEALLMLSYGVLGLVLMWLTRLAFDHFSLPQIDIKELVGRGNLAAGTVVAGNLIATAIIVRAVMVWVDSSSLLGLVAVLIGYLASQLILFLATHYRVAVFARRHADRALHQEISSDNAALALRFAGHRIGVGLAVTAASGLVLYRADGFFLSLLLWVGLALLLFAVQTLISILGRYVLLSGIDVAEEVGNQQNVAVGAMEAAIYIAVGLVLVGLFA